MNTADSPTSLVDIPPDCGAIEREIQCPLCDYNLRGLTEPRCPECGHQSTWAELQAGSERLPGFFEHRCEVIAFIKTWRLSQHPRRFWNLVKPTDQPRVGRLAMYYIVVAVLAVAMGFTQQLVIGVNRYRQTYQKRMQVAEYLTLRKNDVQIRAAIRRAGSIQAIVANAIPYPSLNDAFQRDRSAYPSRSYVPEYRKPLCIAMLLWPWLTLLSLRVFWQTLSRARIKAAHLLRCAVYAFDSCVLLVIPIVAVEGMAGGSFDPYLAYTWLGFELVFDPLLLTLWGAVLLLLTYRLLIGTRTYLRIPHAGATCIASQMMVALAMLALYRRFG